MSCETAMYDGWLGIYQQANQLCILQSRPERRDDAYLAVHAPYNRQPRRMHGAPVCQSGGEELSSRGNVRGRLEQLGGSRHYLQRAKVKACTNLAQRVLS